MLNNIYYVDLSYQDYYRVWCLQKYLFTNIIDIKQYNRKKEIENYILFVEHNHTYTIGSQYNTKDIFLSNFYLECIDAKVFLVDRGGGVAYHGPGQLVIYFILDLELFIKDIKKYFSFLENIIIDLLSYYGLCGFKIRNYTGVWLKNKNSSYSKIAFIGLKLNRWVTMHGLSININTNLNYYTHINPCNLDRHFVTSMNHELGYNIDISDVKLNFKLLFSRLIR